MPGVFVTALRRTLGEKGKYSAVPSSEGGWTRNVYRNCGASLRESARLGPSLRPATGEIGEGLAEWAKVPGGLAVMQILRSRDRNIRRIGSLQSPCNVVATEGICILVVLIDGMLRLSESAD
jgi:hypothetical protein